MAVVGTTPKDGLSMRMGRADAIVNSVGNTYCEECFANRWGKSGE